MGSHLVACSVVLLAALRPGLVLLAPAVGRGVLRRTAVLGGGVEGEGEGGGEGGVEGEGRRRVGV